MARRKPFIAGNWKMNLNEEEAVALIQSIKETVKGMKKTEVLVAPPFTILAKVKKAIGSRAKILLGAQNMHWESSGAFTGEISALMLLEAGCTHVILGHSERRGFFQENDEMVNRKAISAVKTGLIPIVCIGETLEERETDKTFEVIKTQLNGSLRNFIDEKQLPVGLILAYEPVWAIGTGKTAAPEQAQEVHQFIRKWVKDVFTAKTADKIRILYGGSVKPDNIRELMTQPDIDGVLVGGASLKAGSFTSIIRFQ